MHAIGQSDRSTVVCVRGVGREVVKDCERSRDWCERIKKRDGEKRGRMYRLMRGRYFVLSVFPKDGSVEAYRLF